MIGFAELGMDMEPLKEHFIEFLGPQAAGSILKQVEIELTEHARSKQSGSRQAIL